MQRPITRGASANAGLIFHVFVQDSASTTGAGKASIAFGDFSCRYIRNGEAISGAITPQDITTIGTYAAPTANTNVRIKAVDNTNMIGIYEVQIHADWVNTTNSCRSLTIYLSATGAAVRPFTIPLEAIDRQDSVRMGLTALPNAAANAAGGLPISTAGGLNLDSRLDAAITSRMASYTQPTGFLAATFPATLASTTNITAGTITTVTNLTNAPTNGDLTATMKTSVTTATASALATYDGPTFAEMTSAFTEIKGAGFSSTDTLEAIRDRGDVAWITATGFSTLTGGDVADAVWDEVLAGHLTAGSTGAGLNAAGGAGDPWATVLPGAYGAGSAGMIIGTNVNATIGSRATQTSVDDVPTATENADALLKRDWTSVTGEAARSVLNALRFLRNKWTPVGAVIHVKKEDDSTDAWTTTITTDGAAEPITSSDPT